MPKYINTDEIDYKTINYPQYNLYTGTIRVKPLDGFYALKDDIDTMPAADVQEVKHGKWNYYTKTNVICSCCNFIRNIETQIAWEFCPKCGAKMDLEDNDGKIH